MKLTSLNEFTTTNLAGAQILTTDTTKRIKKNEFDYVFWIDEDSNKATKKKLEAWMQQKCRK